MTKLKWLWSTVLGWLIFFWKCIKWVWFKCPKPEKMEGYSLAFLQVLTGSHNNKPASNRAVYSPVFLRAVWALCCATMSVTLVIWLVGFSWGRGFTVPLCPVRSSYLKQRQANYYPVGWFPNKPFEIWCLVRCLMRMMGDFWLFFLGLIRGVWLNHLCEEGEAFKVALCSMLESCRFTVEGVALSKEFT